MKNNLINLLFDCCEESNLSIEKSNIEGIDFIINTTPIIIKDWKRAIGVDIVIQADRTRKNNRIPQVIILTNRYSDPAKALANRISIPLFTEREFKKQTEY